MTNECVSLSTMTAKDEQKFDRRAAALRNNLKRRKELAKEKTRSESDEQDINTEKKDTQ